MIEVKVTEVPGHTGFAEAIMVMEGTTDCKTFMMIGVERTGLLNGQGTFEVSRQSTTSPLTGI